MSVRSVRLQVPAKVNLVLCVGPRREDGYHEVASVMQAISLFDVLEVTDGAPFPEALEVPPSAPGGPEASQWTDPESGSVMIVHQAASTSKVTGALVPAGPQNLVWRAVLALAGRAGRLPHGLFRQPLHLEIRKAIPAGGGLGGGSADAAATLVALNTLWGLGWPREALMEVASTLGSDVPFFVSGGTALASGRGERLLPLVPCSGWMVLANGGQGVPTPTVYRTLDQARGAGGLSGGCAWRLPAQEATEWLARKGPDHGCDLGQLPALGHNDLEGPARTLYVSLGEVATAMERVGLDPHLSGSGGTFWAPAGDENRARTAAGLLAQTGLWAAAVQAVAFGARLQPGAPSCPAGKD